MQRSVLSSILILICAIATVHAQNLTTIDFALTPAPETEIAALATPQTAPPSPAPGQRVDEQVTGALTTASQTVGNVTGAAVGGAANVVGSALGTVANLTQVVSNVASVLGAVASQPTGRKMLMEERSLVEREITGENALAREVLRRLTTN